MIFQQNPQLPSSGSNIGLMIFLIIFSFIACGTSRKGPHKSPDINDNGLPVANEVAMAIDTVRWDIEQPEDYPPMTDRDIEVQVNTGPNLNSELLGQYNISVLLPFLNNQFDRISGEPHPKSLFAYHYYYGMKMAIDRLKSENVSLNIDVHDTQASESIIQSLLNSSSVQSSHLVIGPRKSSGVKLTAEFAKNNGVTHISPFSASTRVTSENPFYTQVRPSLKEHCREIIEHALERHRPDQICLVVQDKNVEKQRLNYFQQYFKANSDTLSKFKEFVIGADITGFVDLNYDPYMIHDGDTTVFIVPSWSNESFIYSFLRQLRVVKGFKPVVVYGMPQWKKYQRNTFDYYEPLNVMVSSDTHLDNNLYDTKQFQKTYYDRYGLLPEEDAYNGYDLMLYVGRMLKEKGTQWQTESTPKNSGMLQSEFDFQPVYKTDDPDNLIQRFENRSVKILKYQDFQFRSAG